jgi:hypothetical protein
MGDCALDEIHPYRTRRLGAELLQLQALLGSLQGKFRVIQLQGQAQALCPLLGL